jgi:hypothetical protein
VGFQFGDVLGQGVGEPMRLGHVIGGDVLGIAGDTDTDTCSASKDKIGG